MTEAEAERTNTDPEGKQNYSAHDMHHGMNLQEGQWEAVNLACDALGDHPCHLSHDENLLDDVGFAFVIDLRSRDAKEVAIRSELKYACCCEAQPAGELQSSVCFRRSGFDIVNRNFNAAHNDEEPVLEVESVVGLVVLLLSIT